MSIEYVIDSDTVEVNIALNETPENPVRYGAVLIKKDIDLTLKIIGTNPNNNLFNVSIVGDNGEHEIVINNKRIELDASKVHNIIGTVYNYSTASSYYTNITSNNYTELPMSLEYIPDSYLIAIAYDTEEKKIVAVAQRSID